MCADIWLFCFEGLKDMLQIIASQWQELQKQIKRQHSWILRALDIIKAEILATDVTAHGLEGTGNPKVSQFNLSITLKKSERLQLYSSLLP